ncbi:MAG TPA: type VI secretion system accessory protein TagJ [Pyrinomonadaceae bacterium]|jgi:type VI secretion system protein ImpE
MTRAKALYEAGELEEAIEELTREVKAAPADAGPRTFLFELLCFAGQWERAARQLEVVAHQSAQAEAGAAVYRNLIEAERARTRHRRDGVRPRFFFEPPPYVLLLLDAFDRLREGRWDEARSLLDEAEGQRPALSGTLGGARFEDFRDYDDAVAPVLEVFALDQYAWLPLEQVRRVESAAPSRLRDLLWAPARVEAAGGVLGEFFLPVLYAGSSEHAEPQVRLGRVTDWTRPGGREDLLLAAGARLFLADGEETSLLEVRELEFDPAPEEAQGPPS